MCVSTHQFLASLSIVVNDGLTVEKSEDSFGRELGLDIVWSECSGLTDGEGTKHKSDEGEKDIIEIFVNDRIV